MIELVIRNERLVEQLFALANRRKQSVEDALSDLLTSETSENSSEPAPGSAKKLLQVALEANLATPDEVDTSDKSREILQTEFADYLKQRML